MTLGGLFVLASDASNRALSGFWEPATLGHALRSLPFDLPIPWSIDGREILAWWMQTPIGVDLFALGVLMGLAIAAMKGMIGYRDDDGVPSQMGMLRSHPVRKPSPVAPLEPIPARFTRTGGMSIKRQGWRSLTDAP